jgi:hypothetical protein
MAVSSAAAIGGEGMAKDSSRGYEKRQRELFRQNVHRIWNMVRLGQYDELTEKESRLAEILTGHEEYREHFENVDILDGREYEAGMQFNPFLHISTHLMVEDQLAASQPIEAALFCEAMEDKGYAHHESVHFIIMILLHVMHASASGKIPFDAARYRRLLDKCAQVEPSAIERVIEEDFSADRKRHNLH